MEFLAHRRLNRVHGTDLERGIAGWTSLGLRAYVVHTQGAAFDARVWPMGIDNPTARNALLTIPLRGRYLSFRAGGSIVARAGLALVERSTTWLERWEDDMRALVLQWAPRFGTPRVGDLPLGEADLVHARALADAIETTPPGAVSAPPVFGAFWERLRALGLDLLPLPDVILPPVPPLVSCVESVVSWLFCNYPIAPSAQDLVERTGYGERHLRRIFEEHAGWLGNFRNRRQRGRLTSAVSWLAETDLPFERLAPSLGYGSGRALARALDDIGFAGRASARLAL